MTFQAIVTPDGLIPSLAGPFEGRCNDWYMFQESGVFRRLQQMIVPGRRDLFLYGDPAYHDINYYCIAPFRDPRAHGNLSREQCEFNKRLASVRISVEHGFGQIGQTWTYNCFAQQLHSGWQPVAAFFITGVLLTNCHTCLYPNQTSQKHKISPLTLEEYLILPGEESGDEGRQGDWNEGSGEGVRVASSYRKSTPGRFCNLSIHLHPRRRHRTSAPTVDR